MEFLRQVSIKAALKAQFLFSRLLDGDIDLSGWSDKKKIEREKLKRSQWNEVENSPSQLILGSTAALGVG